MQYIHEKMKESPSFVCHFSGKGKKTSFLFYVCIYSESLTFLWPQQYIQYITDPANNIRLGKRATLYFRKVIGCCRSVSLLQVNLRQKLSFLNQLTHNRVRDCSLSFPRKIQAHNMLCTKIVFLIFVLIFKTVFVFFLNLYFSLNSMSNLLSYCGLFSWCENKSFYQRYTCT